MQTGCYYLRYLGWASTYLRFRDSQPPTNKKCGVFQPSVDASEIPNNHRLAEKKKGRKEWDGLTIPTLNWWVYRISETVNSINPKHSMWLEQYLYSYMYHKLKANVGTPPKFNTEHQNDGL